LGSVAPTVRSFSADFEPLRLVSRYPEYYPGLLESGAAAAPCAASARYDILPISSGEILELGPAQRLCGAHAAGARGFFDALERWWADLQMPAAAHELPFQGGWLVYLSYELAAEIEPTLRLAASPEPLGALAIRTPAAWVRERSAGRAWLVCEQGSEALLDRFAAHAGALPPTLQRSATEAAEAPHIEMHEDPPERFLAAVRDALEYIAAGDVYQANLSRQWSGAAAQTLDPVAIYRRLRATNPSPFAGLLRHGDFAVLSSSPERLVSIREDVVSTRPIAGTRPRGASPEADAALIRTLLENEKERAEHVMLIDLERNDLGRVCVGGSVRVDEYMSVETYAHVHHIVSNVSGHKRPGVTPVQVMRAMFPGGTITGCPKVRCMQIIAELESGARGAYTGSLGYLNRDGSCDFNILIRTITVSGNAVRFRAGAGIVADSEPEQELAETRAKAEGMLRAMRPAA
jgi:4-amino-4-deoxychorismate synthase (2-amino-4-deoxychorismate-forming) component I